MYSGQAAIDYLAVEVSKQDSGESSHWRKYHSEFNFTGDGFEGLQGFGGSQKPYRGLRLWLHRILQRRFRKMAAIFPDFKSIDEQAEKITASQGRAYDLDVLRQALTIAFLKNNHLSTTPSSQATVCVIGDGFASMTALLLASSSASRVVLVNLTKTLLVDLWYLKLWMGAEKFNAKVTLVTDEDGLVQALARQGSSNSLGGEVIAIQAVDHELLQRCPVDIALNIASMQEMDPSVISAYFDDLRTVASHRKLTFYCCNREEKLLPDGTVTRFAEYPWNLKDKILIDERCPWTQQYYTFSPPFFRPYDGSFRHRLAEIEQTY